MIEELKIVVDLLKAVSGDASTTIIWYLVLEFLKKPICYFIIGLVVYKSIELITSVRTTSKEVSIEDFKN
jgi:hypothetical protein